MTECDTYAINWQAFGKAVVFENIQFTEDGIFLFLIRLYFSKSLKCELPVWTCLFLLGFFHHFLTLPPLSQFLSRRPELDHNRLNTLIVYFNLPNGNPFFVSIRSRNIYWMFTTLQGLKKVQGQNWAKESMDAFFMEFTL